MQGMLICQMCLNIFYDMHVYIHTCIHTYIHVTYYRQTDRQTDRQTGNSNYHQMKFRNTMKPLT